MLRSALAVSLALTLSAGAAPQGPLATAPHWSTYFGGSLEDYAVAVRFGPGQLVTVAGYTGSSGMATTGAFQTVLGGSQDVFVARFDPSQLPGQQLLWCTYLGGSDIDIAFDLQVDAQGVTTVVGVTASPDFPVRNEAQSTRNGSSDGFIAQIDPVGSSLLYSTYFGGSLNERICDVVLGANSIVVVAGNTESTDLPGTAGTVWPAYHGGTNDGFVARLDLSQPQAQQIRWATYLGGSDQEGPTWSWFVSNGGATGVWFGNLDRTGVALEPNGNVVAATVARSFDAQTTPGCYQSFNAGPADVYLVRLDPTGTNLLYATYFGGSAQDNPKCLVLHPAGGVVLGGNTASSDMPVTRNCFQQFNQFGTFGVANDGFLFWIDPAGNGTADLRYATYFGGNGGEDSVLAIAIESSGIVTVGGYLSGGSNFPTTPRGLQPTTLGGQYCGMVARIELAGQGVNDLLHATHIGDNWTVLTGLDIDPLGDAIVCGGTFSGAFPTAKAHQWTLGGGIDGAITFLPLLPGGADRADLALATPACGTPLHTGMAGAPVSGSANFGLTASNAPPGSLGLMVLGVPPAPPPVPLLNATLLVAPAINTLVTADALGFVRYGIALPASMPPTWRFHVQWLFLTNPACPGSGILAASERLEF